MFRKSIFLSAVLCTVLACSLAVAQSDVAELSEQYGNGVHAYFDGDFDLAIQSLSAAIDGGINDPRANYFRGLTYMKLNREREAKADFAAGAKIETGSLNRIFNVSQALARVQGADRLLLEKYREEARLQAYNQELEMRRQRYNDIRQAASRVELNPNVTQPPISHVTEAPAVGSLIDPFSEAPSTAAAVTPGTPATSPQENVVEIEIETPAVTDTTPATPVDPGDMTDPFGAVGAGADNGSSEVETTGVVVDVQVDDPQGTVDAIGGALMQVFGGLGGQMPGMDGPAGMDDPMDMSSDTDPFGAGGMAPIQGEEDPFGDAFGDTDDSGMDTPATDGSDPFGGSADPFGGSADPFGGSADPFDTGDSEDSSDADDSTDADPFGASDPFGN